MNAAWWNEEPSKMPFASPQDGKCKVCPCLFAPSYPPQDEFMKVHCLQVEWNRVQMELEASAWNSSQSAINLRLLDFSIILWSSALSFGRISNVMVRKETSGFWLAWCGIWKLCNGIFSVRIVSASVRLKISFPLLSLYYMLRYRSDTNPWDS